MLSKQETLRDAITHLRHPKGMSCLECGFLAFGDGEMITFNRGFLREGLFPFLTKASAATLPQQHGISPHLEHTHPNCFKSLWVRDSERAGYGIIDEVVKRRRPCEGFFPYKPGYSPSEHRALQENKQARNEKITVGILSALGGAAITLVLSWFKKHFNL